VALLGADAGSSFWALGDAVGDAWWVVVVVAMIAVAVAVVAVGMAMLEELNSDASRGRDLTSGHGACLP
jgi:hypothetical protein